MQILLGEIFGRQMEHWHIDGLVDAESEEEFHDGLKTLCQKWEQFDSSQSGPMHSFTKWFNTYTCDTIKQTMLRPIQREAEL